MDWLDTFQVRNLSTQLILTKHFFVTNFVFSNCNDKYMITSELLEKISVTYSVTMQYKLFTHLLSTRSAYVNVDANDLSLCKRHVLKH